MVKVKARVENLTGYSAHRDSDGLLEFVDNSAETLKKVFVVMGEQNQRFSWYSVCETTLE